MGDRPIGPDERALRAHLRSARFQAGVDAGRWRLVGDIVWPHVLIAISAPPKPGVPCEFVVKFELTDYPTQAPLGILWDAEADVMLPAAKRPKGGRVEHLFRDWNGGQGLYAPWDRLGLAHWPVETYPRDAWTQTRDLAFYLSKVHDELHCGEYLGI